MVGYLSIARDLMIGDAGIAYGIAHGILERDIGMGYWIERDEERGGNMRAETAGVE